MRIVLQFTSQEELKALDIVLRHSPGMILPDRRYVVSVEAAKALRDAGVKFKELGSEADAPTWKSRPRRKDMIGIPEA